MCDRYYDDEENEIHRCNRCGDKYCDGLKNCPDCGEDMLCDSDKCHYCYNPYDEDFEQGEDND